MKNMTFALLALLIINPLIADSYEVNLVSQEDTSFLLDRIKKLEQKAKIRSNQWDIKATDSQNNKYLVFEEIDAEGNIHQSGKIEAFQQSPHSNDRISITFENDKTIQSCKSSKECIEYPASLVTFKTQTMMMTAQIFRVTEVRYENIETGDDGLLCTIKTDRGTTHRLRLISE